MILVSMITLIMAFALRINLQAWERGVNEGDKIQIEVVLLNMLERQLRFIRSSASFANTSLISSASLETRSSQTQTQTSLITAANALSRTANLTLLKFTGEEHNLSFYTLYSPQGTPSQGLVRVAYIYDQAAKKLTVYEKMIGSEEDIKASDSLFSAAGKSGVNKKKRTFSGEAVPVATITDVEKFSLSFMPKEDSTVLQGSALKNPPYGSTSSLSSKRSSSRNSSDSKINGESFQESWDENSSDPPGFIRLLFAQTKLRGSTPSVWLFKVGGRI